MRFFTCIDASTRATCIVEGSNTWRRNSRQKGGNAAQGNAAKGPCVTVRHTCDGVDHGAQDGGRLDELFQDVGLGGERKSVVQHFLQELVDHHHIVLDSSFCADPKIVLAGGDEKKEEEKSEKHSIKSKRFPPFSFSAPGTCRPLCAGTR